MQTVRIGILGAARIAPAAVIKPAAGSDGVEIAAVAARDTAKARAFATEHGIARVLGGYQELIESDVDAIYNPLPNGLHGVWTMRALAAGKHVLCEKPFTANATEARAVAAAARGSGLVVMEAFHYRYHPLGRRMAEAVAQLGRLIEVEARFCFPLPRFSDIRYDLRLAGGALMDAGCYPVHLVRALGGGEPEVVAARAKLHGPEVDRAMRATLRFPEGHTGAIRCSMWSRELLAVTARAVGERGELRVVNPIAPQFGHRFSLTVDGRRTRERFTRRSTYAHQLDAFAAAVRGEDTNLTPPEDSIATMTVIDAIYTAAGLHPRTPTP